MVWAGNRALKRSPSGNNPLVEAKQYKLNFKRKQQGLRVIKQGKQ